MKKTAFLVTLLVTIAVLASAVSAYTLTDYEVPVNGTHFAFDGSFATDSGDLTAVPFGNVPFVEGHDGKANGAAYFETAGDGLELLKNDYFGDYTVSAWVKMDEAVNYAFVLISKGYSIRSVQYAAPLGECGVSDVTVTPNYNGYVSEGLAIEEWGMITFVFHYDDQCCDFYLNGEYLESLDCGPIGLPLTLIGNDSADNCNWQIDQYMTIDDLWIVGRCLSKDEVAELYSNNTVAAVGDDFVATKGVDPNFDPAKIYEIPADGAHFAFNGSFATDAGDLEAEALGTPTFVEGHDGTAEGAVYFDLAEDCLVLGKNSLGGDYTVSTWVKMDEPVAYSFILMSKNASLRAAQYAAPLGECGFSNGKDPYFSYAAEFGAWTMLTFVYHADTETMDLYANGEYKESLSGNGSVELPLGYIGNDCADNCNWQVDEYMTLDDLWIFEKVLSADEIMSLYTNNAIAAPAEEAPAAEEAVEAPAEEEAPAAEETAEEIVVEEPELAEAPAAEETAEAPAAAEEAPQTADGVLFLALLALVACSGAVIFKKTAVI